MLFVAGAGDLEWDLLRTGGVGDVRTRGLRIKAGRVDGLEEVAMRHGGWRESWN